MSATPSGTWREMGSPPSARGKPGRTEPGPVAANLAKESVQAIAEGKTYGQ